MRPWVWCQKGVCEAEEDLIFDPQTSGGLLISVEEAYAEEILKALKQSDIRTPFAVIGKVLEKKSTYMEVKKAGGKS